MYFDVYVCSTDEMSNHLEIEISVCSFVLAKGASCRRTWSYGLLYIFRNGDERLQQLSERSNLKIALKIKNFPQIK